MRARPAPGPRIDGAPVATAEEPVESNPNDIAALAGVTTATITTLLLKQGLRNVYMRGTKPLGGKQARVVVVDARGVRDAGIFGDILCARMQRRGVAALVTDGVVRDAHGVLETGLPVWCAGAAAPPSVAGLTFVNWQEPIGCGGVAIFPDDVIVADDDGAVVIPGALAAGLISTALEQERFEAWIMDEVARGTPLPGLYPPNAETKARYEASRGAASQRVDTAK